MRIRLRIDTVSALYLSWFLVFFLLVDMHDKVIVFIVVRIE